VKLRTALLLALLMVVGMIANSSSALATTNAETSHASAVIPSPAGGYDGKTLYLGLAFGQGPVGALFPELEGLRTMTADKQELADATMAEISNLDPTFFDRFAGAIQSGDRVQIRAALNEADDLGGMAANRIAPSEHQGRMVADQDLAFVFVVFVVIIVVLVDFLAPTREAVTPLDRDIMANRIADVLGPQS